jgi:hypothetical protein
MYYNLNSHVIKIFFEMICILNYFFIISFLVHIIVLHNGYLCFDMDLIII